MKGTGGARAPHRAGRAVRGKGKKEKKRRKERKGQNEEERKKKKEQKGIKARSQQRPQAQTPPYRNSCPPA